MQTRLYGKARHIQDIPNLCETQRKFYADFLQLDALPNERKRDGLQAISRSSIGEHMLNHELAHAVRIDWSLRVHLADQSGRGMTEHCRRGREN